MTRRHRGAIAMLFVVTALSCSLPGTNDTSGPQTASTVQPPPDGGYFHTRAEGTWRRLPSGTTCEGLIHRSSWEPRPLNAEANGRVPDPIAVREAFTARPRSDTGGFAPRWDSWLLRRVDGGFTGTTDEIFQWAACKWGLADNLLRAIAVRESTWYQDATSTSGAVRSELGLR